MTMTPWKIIPIADETAMTAFAINLAPHLKAGDKIALSGPLGAGKSTLARAIIHDLCESEEVPSPTFTLVQTYDTKSGDQVWHFDFYRLNDPEEAYELAIEEAFENAVCLMEWPEKLGQLLPEDSLLLTIEPIDDGTLRRIEIHATPDWQNRLGAALDTTYP